MSDETGKLSDEEVSNAILEILSGERFVHLETLNLTCLFKQPSYRDKLYATFLERQQTVKYAQEGYILEKDVTTELLQEFFTVEDQDELEELQSKLYSYRMLLQKRSKNSDQYLIDAGRIQGLEAREQSLIYKKNSIQQATADYRAREDKLLYLLSKSVCTVDGAQVWSSVDDLFNSISTLNQVYLLLSAFLNFYYGYSVGIIRQIARHNLWKNYYLSSKKGLLTLFANNTENLSIDQLNLLSWSIFYSDIYELSYKDRPDNSVIEDDVKLDRYIKELTRKVEAEQRLQGSNRGNRLNASDSQHVIITAESENYVKFKKDNLYSDTSLITGRAKEGSTKYSEADELKAIKRRNRSLNSRRK